MLNQVRREVEIVAGYCTYINNKYRNPIYITVDKREI